MVAGEPPAQVGPLLCACCGLPFFKLNFPVTMRVSLSTRLACQGEHQRLAGWPLHRSAFSALCRPPFKLFFKIVLAVCMDPQGCCEQGKGCRGPSLLNWTRYFGSHKQSAQPSCCHTCLTSWLCGCRWYRDPNQPIARTDITRFPHAVLEVKLSLPEGQAAPEWVADLTESGFLTEVHSYSSPDVSL